MNLFKETLFLKAFSLWKIPLIYFVKPSIKEINNKRVIVKIPLIRRNKNHLNSMYFGALCIGADCAGGILAVRKIREEKLPVQFVFKDFSAKFLKRPTKDVYFICNDGEKIEILVNKAMSSTDRQEDKVLISASTDIENKEVVAEFELTISLKKKS